jgi:hypothetical protein
MVQRLQIARRDLSLVSALDKFDKSLASGGLKNREP